jgi:hypothetical protein
VAARRSEPGARLRRGHLCPDGGAVPYWWEEAFYELTLEQVDELEAVTVELHEMCVAVARTSSTTRRGSRLRPAAFGARADAGELRGATVAVRTVRPWSTTGSTPQSCSSTTPTPLLGLLESSVAQWFWLEDVMPSCDQWNSIHERLIARWRQIALRLNRDATGQAVLHLATVAGEDSARSG